MSVKLGLVFDALVLFSETKRFLNGASRHDGIGMGTNKRWNGQQRNGKKLRITRICK